MAKILCPVHEDTTPSMEVYEDMGYCFVCSATVPIDQLNVEYVKRPPTSIPEMMEYIDGLPLQSIRGLNLPADDRGYFITWPTRDYYKHRFWMGNVRYSGPRGHRPPVFTYQKDYSNLVLVEGELNAISLDMCSIPHTVASFGAASNALSYIDYYLKFDRIHAIFDKDGPGVAYGLKLRESLRNKRKRMELILVETDYNDILQKSGVEGVQQEVKNLGL